MMLFIDDGFDTRQVHVEATNTIEKLEGMLMTMYGDPPQALRFFMDGKELFFDTPLDHANIRDGSTVQVLFGGVPCMFARLFTGRTLILYGVTPDDDVETLMEVVTARESYDPDGFRLWYNAVLLVRGFTLEHFGIQSGSLIEVSMKQELGMMYPKF